MNIKDMIGEELDLNAMQAGIAQAKKTHSFLVGLSNNNEMLRQKLTPEIEAVNKLFQSLDVIVKKDAVDKKNKAGAKTGIGTTVSIKEPEVAPAETPVIKTPTV